MVKRVLSAVFAAALVIGLFFSLPFAANATSEMAVSDICVEMIKRMEGFVAIPRWDYGQWTVGFGSRCPDEDLARYQKEGIPMDEADALMRRYLETFEKSVNSYADRHDLTLTQGQFDALVCMTYNLGTSILHNTSNMINTAILGGASENELIYAFSVYCTAGGEFLPGLIRRRLVEANMYINGEYGDYAPENYCYVLYDANGGTKDVSAQGFDCNLPAEPLSRPTREGYTFAGWYTAANSGTRVTALNESHSGMTLYAHWEKGSTSGDASSLPQGGLKVTVQIDAVNVRNGAGNDFAIVGGVFRDEELTITALATVDGKRWGRFEKGWIPLQYTNYGELTGDYGDQEDSGTDAEVIEVPVRATVLSSAGVTVYNGPHTTYPKVATLPEGTEIEITEVFTLFDTNWGKCESGWVQLNLKLQLHDDQRLAHPFMATVNYSYLNVRSGPGTQYGRTGSLQNGAKVEIVAVVYVGDVPWGRCSDGWISLDYTDFDEDKLEQYRSHSYGDWYISQNPGCETAGQERRDCQYCQDYETRGVTATGHSYGSWYESQAGTCVTPGQERRDCAGCGSFETRESALGDHSFGQWYETEAGTCVTPSQERRNCQYCDAFETREGTAGGHSYGDWYESQAGTCVTPGQECRDCAHCDAFETRETAISGHHFGDWYVSREATCVATGQERRDCEYCDAFETKSIATAAHEYGDWVIHMAPTCTSVGQERRTCANCGNYEGREVPMAEHSLGLWYETVTPTVDAAGEERRDCENCDYFEIRVLEPTEHIFGQWYETVAPQCTEPGQQQRDCSHCDLKQTRQTPALGHSVGAWETVTEPTCETEGSQKRLCQLCGQEELETIPATGHSYGVWYTLLEPTCTEPGTKGSVCDVCAQLQTGDIAPLGHELSQWVTAKEPTCTTDGEQIRGCVRCREPERQSIPALGHDFSEWETVVEALCGQIGQERRVCRTCGEEETRQVEAADHSFGEWTISLQPTCDTAGREIRTCQNCGYAEQQELPALGHSLGEWFIHQSATCGAAGEERRQCQNCDYYESREIPALTHSYGAWYIYKEAGCGVEGETRRDCANCGSYDSAPIPAKSHSFGDWQTHTPAGCEQTGEERRTCASCGYAEVRTTEAVGHRYGDWYVAKAPTTQAEGEERRDCANCDGYQSRVIERLTATVTKIYGTLTEEYYVNVRTGPATTYDKVNVLFFGARVEILEQKTIYGSQVWGRIGEDAWVRLTDYFTLETVEEPVAQTVVKTYATITCSLLNIRIEADADSDAVGYLLEGTQVVILEQKQIGELLWGRITEGWICLTDNADLRTETITTAAPTYSATVFGTVIKTPLNIRAGAGTGYSKLGSLNMGDHVEILEMTLVNTWVWGRFEGGWIRLDGFVELELEVETDSHTHSFGDWYVTQAASCTTAGQEHRVCSGCGETESRTIAALGHSFGAWTVITEGNCSTPVEEARICTNCGETEIRIGESANHDFGEWTVKNVPTCTAPGVEVRVCGLCGIVESRSVAANGHSFGAWYRTKEPTYEEEGQERRDCGVCGSFETRAVDKLINTITTVTKIRATVTSTSLSIRAGASSQTEKLGTLVKGTTVELLEIVTAGTQTWGRFEKGWICLFSYTSLVTVREEADMSTHLTIHATVAFKVNIRSGPGTSYTKLGSMQVGQKVEILEMVTSGTQTWGRYADGWIRLDGYVTLVATPQGNGETEQPEEPAGEFDGGVSDEWFENVLFIGDSRFVGLQMYARSGNATYFCDVGMSLFNYTKKVLSDDSYTDLTLVQLLATHSYDKVILNFGLNECGYATSTLLNKYRQLIELIQGTQEDAVIIINGVMSVSAKKASQASYFEPEHLAEISDAFAGLADGETIYYIDCNEYFTDSDGYLLSEYTSDGYHPNVTGYRRWRDWMAYAIAQLGIE